MADDQAARIAALATQVALLHNALRKAVDEIVDLRESEGVPRETALEDPLLRGAVAALEASEGDCGDLLTLARACGERVLRPDDYGILPFAAEALVGLVDRIEGKA